MIPPAIKALIAIGLLERCKAPPPKKPADLNRLAAAIVDHATTEEDLSESQRASAGGAI